MRAARRDCPIVVFVYVRECVRACACLCADCLTASTVARLLRGLHDHLLRLVLTQSLGPLVIHHHQAYFAHRVRCRGCLLIVSMRIATRQSGTRTSTSLPWVCASPVSG